MMFAVQYLQRCIGFVIAIMLNDKILRYCVQYAFMELLLQMCSNEFNTEELEMEYAHISSFVSSLP